MYVQYTLYIKELFDKVYVQQLYYNSAMHHCTTYIYIYNAKLMIEVLSAYEDSIVYIPGLIDNLNLTFYYYYYYYY